MASLTLKNLPDPLLERLRRRAEADRRSLTQEILYLLETALDRAAGEASFGEERRSQVEAWSSLAGRWRSDPDPAPEAERLATELAELTGESKTEAVRQALAARKEQLAQQVVRRRKGESFLQFLAEEVWPHIPESELGRRLTKEEREEILGYGPEGV